jgi:hypothetical protein
MVSARTTPAPWFGWIAFAATMLLVIGVLNILEGLVALVDDRRLVIAQNRLIAVDLTGWGWTLLIFGIVLVAISLGLYSGANWARITAVVIVALHAVAQVGWLAAYPVWSLLMITLDIVVLYALTARWPTVADRADRAADRADR